MNNYEYIIASLPVLSSEGSNNAVAAAGLDTDALLLEIREQCSDKDNALIDFVVKSIDGEQLDAEFYREAAKSRNKFVREYFAFDLALRNAKVRYLNQALGRAEGTDIVSLDDEQPDEPSQELDAIFQGKDLLSREKAIDDAVWAKVEEIVIMEVFSIDVVLAFIVKLGIVSRWLKLDEQTGREMFRKLVDEVRGTFKGVNYVPENK